MRRARLLALAGGAAVLWASPALGDGGEGGFGVRDKTVLTLENVAGVAHQRVSYPERDRTAKVTTVGVFQDLLYAGPPLPRLGVHRFLNVPVSLGLGLFFSDVDHTGTFVVLAPRVGYAIPIGEETAVWLRGGVSYFHLGFDDQDGHVDNVMPGGEVLLALSPARHFGVLLGATVEAGVAGEREIESSSDDIRFLTVGGTVGFSVEL